MAERRRRSLRHRCRLGRRARGAHRRRARRARDDRRGISRRRHLRDPRLCPEEALGLREPFRARIRGRRRLRLDGFRREVRLADADREQGQGDRAARGGLSRDLSARWRRDRRSRAVVEDAHTLRLLEDRRARSRRDHSGRDRRPSRAARNIPGAELAITSNEAFHLERAAAADRDPGRRLYRGRSSPACSTASARM